MVMIIGNGHGTKVQILVIYPTIHNSAMDK